MKVHMVTITATSAEMQRALDEERAAQICTLTPQDSPLKALSSGEITAQELELLGFTPNGVGSKG